MAAAHSIAARPGGPEQSGGPGQSAGPGQSGGPGQSAGPARPGAGPGSGPDSGQGSGPAPRQAAATAAAPAPESGKALVAVSPPAGAKRASLARAAVARLPVELDVAVPVRDFRVRQLLALERGQLIESHWAPGDDVPLTAGEVQLAWSEFEVIDELLAVRITRLP